MLAFDNFSQTQEERKGGRTVAIKQRSGALKQIPPHAALYDPDATYETRKWLYRLALPVMWVLTIWVAVKKMWYGHSLTTNTYWFDGISPICRRIKEGAATWQALDLIYNHRFGSEGIITDFWLGMQNAQAVRNRMNLTKDILAETLRKFAVEEETHLLSLASGSAQCVIEALAYLKAEGFTVKALLLDVDTAALEHSIQLAQHYGVQAQITTLKIDLRDLVRLEKSLKDYPPFHVVEMVGFIEYFPDKRVIKLMKSIRLLLRPNGVFMTSSIRSNPERWFLHWVINWEMIYRSPKELRSIIQAAKFQDLSIHTEPLSIYDVAVCRK